MAKIQSITTGPRQSNFELLRIVAMFMVLGVHANYLSLGRPSVADTLCDSTNALTRDMLEMFCLGCVDIFVLISGWFGIRFSLKGLAGFFFQGLYFVVLVSTAGILSGQISFSKTVVMDCLFINPATGWFIREYAILYILSPALNACADKLSKRGLDTLLVLFFVFQTLFGLLNFTNDGYNFGAFIGLYLLARRVKLYGSAFCTWGGVFYRVGRLRHCCIFKLLFPCAGNCRLDSKLYKSRRDLCIAVIGSCVQPAESRT